jgi:hypothetical protein
MSIEDWGTEAARPIDRDGLVASFDEGHVGA